MAEEAEPEPEPAVAVETVPPEAWEAGTLPELRPLRPLPVGGVLKRLGPSGLRVGGDDLADVLERAYEIRQDREAVTELEQEVDAVAAETGFSGVVRVDRAGTTELAKAYGLAHRGYEIPNTIETRFATASATKGSDRARGREPDRGRLA